MTRTRKRKETATDEEIRLTILKFLYDAHRKAGTLSGGRFQIRKLKRELKESGLGSAEITRNLDYLVQNEWIIKESEPYTMKRSGKTITSKRVTYRISSRGIDLFLGPSQFQAPGSLYGINIVQNAPGIIQVGSFNFVNARFRDLYKSLDSFGRVILLSDQLQWEDKIRILVDVRTLQAQLMRPDPNASVLRKLWSSIRTAGSIGTFAALIERIAELLAPLI